MLILLTPATDVPFRLVPGRAAGGADEGAQKDKPQGTQNSKGREEK